MATVEQCEQALQGLAGKLAGNDAARRKAGFDRTLSCTLRDLDITFAGRLHDGLLTDIERTAQRDAQVKLDLTSDDLLALVDGNLNLASAWASGRVKVEAGVLDLVKLRSVL